MAIIGTDLLIARSILRNGGLVAIPTETVYGLAANALDENAVLKIFEAKGRPHFDPLIVHVSSLEMCRQFATFNDEQLLKLAERFWPGPLTLLLPKSQQVPDLVTSGLERVAIRMPDHPMTLHLIQQMNIPLAAPSANPFGYISPTEPAHVNKQLGQKVDYILDGGSSSVGIESTIVGVEDGQVFIYRLGGLTLEAIEKVVGKVELRVNLSGDPRAPGQLKNHYAPNKKLIIGEPAKILAANSPKKLSLICFGSEAHPGFNKIYRLSEKNDLAEAAINLFKFLREADDDSSELLVAQELPSVGLGLAINDRLKRAAV